MAAVAPGRVQEGVRAENVGFDSLGGALQDEMYADGGRQMHNCVGATGEPIQHMIVVKRSVGKGKAGALLQALDVFERASAEIVKYGDGIAATEQSVGEVAADESGPAGNQDMHRHLSTAVVIKSRLTVGNCSTPAAKF